MKDNITQLLDDIHTAVKQAHEIQAICEKLIQKMNHDTESTMTHNEQRAYRIDCINGLVQLNYHLRRLGRPLIPCSEIKRQVREYELVNIGYELNTYKTYKES